MKNLIIATTIALGLASAGGVSSAQDETRATNMQNVTVTEAPAQYETYVVDLHLGYGLAALVGNTHRQYMRAQRVAETSEALRMRGTPLQPNVAVAIDNSSAPGVTKQLLLIDSAQDTVAIVDVYCKQVVPSGSAHCLLVPLPMGTSTNSQRLASRQVGQLQLAQVELQD